MNALRRELFPSAGRSLPNDTDLARTLLGAAKSPRTAWLLQQLFGATRQPFVSSNATRAGPIGPKIATPKGRTGQVAGTLHVAEREGPEGALIGREIEIPVFTVIGVFVFVCVGAGAVVVVSVQ